MYNGYKYHICVENYTLPAYVSEKVTSALAYGTRPVYLGSPLMNSYVICLTGDLQKDLQIIARLCVTDDIPEKSADVFFQDYNFGNFLCKEFKIDQPVVEDPSHSMIDQVR